MSDFEARKVIEALRSGVSSRAVGQYFSSARRDLLSGVSAQLSHVCESRVSEGMLITGAYGEGKTHLLNTVFNMAHENNMAVSFVSLSKETPFDKPYFVYQKLLSNTYLPKRLQPGFFDMLNHITPNSPLASEMLAYTAKHLEVDKLFYLLRAFFSTDDMDEKFLLQGDLEGNLVSNVKLRQIYRRIFSEKAVSNTNFSKTKHMSSYFSMISRLFLAMGYAGWVILFDEGELIGRLGKKARLIAYKHMADFLFPKESLTSVYTLFAFTTSYIEDVIEGKHEFENLAKAELDPHEKEPAERTLRALMAAKQLQPLRVDEIKAVMESLLDFYKRAYDWNPDISMDEIMKRTDHRGYLLRTRIRAAVEFLDQLYQYGSVADIKINALGQVSYEEDIPSLEGVLDGVEPDLD